MLSYRGTKLLHIQIGKQLNITVCWEYALAISQYSHCQAHYFINWACFQPCVLIIMTNYLNRFVALNNKTTGTLQFYNWIDGGSYMTYLFNSMIQSIFSRNFVLIFVVFASFKLQYSFDSATLVAWSSINTIVILNHHVIGVTIRHLRNTYHTVHVTSIQLNLKLIVHETATKFSEKNNTSDLFVLRHIARTKRGVQLLRWHY